MPEIPLKFKTEYPPNNGSPVVEIIWAIDIQGSVRCEESIFSAEMREKMEKSIARYLENKLFHQLKHAIYTAREEVLANPYPDYNLVNEIFSRIESAIPKITP
jgi:hypothetical protein